MSAPKRARVDPAQRLQRAAELGDLNAARELLEEDKSLVNATWNGNQNGHNATLLNTAAFQGDVYMAALALKYGANIEHRVVYTENPDEKEGWTPLMISVSHGFINLVDLLLKHGAVSRADDRRCIAMANSTQSRIRIRDSLEAHARKQAQDRLVQHLLGIASIRNIPEPLLGVVSEYAE